MTEIPKLAAKEREILDLLVASKQELYGLQIVDRSGGRISRGSVYVLLGRMKERGLVASRVEQDAKVPGMPRQLYRATGLGLRVLRLYNRFAAEAGRLVGPALA